MNPACPFCSAPPDRIVWRNALCYARYDGFPLNNGHLLIVPFRHIADFFLLSPEERQASLELVCLAQSELDRSLKPDGYNVGINVGGAAGQTVPHVHIHLIPRYLGDVPDPRGGVRWVLPAKANYWQK
jgi:diadenosine tetraphosphate (Ap4A) HIT family hydrolase